jgi:hypothetical protein
MRTLTRGFWLLALAALLPAVPLHPVAAADSCDALPRSALRPRECNPRQECLRAIPADLKGPAREARERECSRQPASGTCYGPQTYNPQAECRSARKK